MRGRLKWSHPGVLKGDKNRLNFRWSKNVDSISIRSIPLANYVIFSDFHLLNFSRRNFHSALDGIETIRAATHFALSDQARLSAEHLPEGPYFNIIGDRQ